MGFIGAKGGPSYLKHTVRLFVTGANVMARKRITKESYDEQLNIQPRRSLKIFSYGDYYSI